MKAIIVVDMQNDFVLADGALAIPDCDKLVDAVDTVADKYPLKVFTKDWHPKNDPSFKSAGGIWPDHCLRGTWGAMLVPGMKSQNEADLVIHKVGYSAFFTRPNEPTGLHGYLRENWVDELCIVGVALDYCVKATALDAVNMGYGVSIVLAATRAVTQDAAKQREILAMLRKEGVGIS